MRIGVDVRVLMDREYSGISEYLANLLTEILKEDKENTYQLFANSGRKVSNKLLAWSRDNTNLVVTRYPNKFFNYVLQKLFSYPKLDKIVGGVDFFWYPHFNFSSLSAGTKSIITVHDLSFLRYPEFFSIRKNFWHKSLSIKRTIREAELVVAVSENTKNDIIELIGVNPEKVRVIYSGNNIQNIHINATDKANFNKKYNISKSYILYLGNIEPRKNLSSLIQAYNQLRSETSDYDNVQLILAGGVGWRNKKIFREQRRSPYRKDIKFLGYINQREKEILYAQAQVFVFP